MNPASQLIHLPIGYAPILTRISRSADQDIEVLFYGRPGGSRLTVFRDLCQNLVRAVFVHGLYRASRDSLIAQSKLVLKVTQWTETNMFEIVLVSYLLANRKAAVPGLTASSKIEEGIAQAVNLVPPERVVDECVRLLADEPRRRHLEEARYQFIARRDIRRMTCP